MSVRYLNLLQIRLPLPGIVSILHRISGVALMGALPFALWFLDMALSGEAEYARAAEFAAHPLVKFLIWGACWALLHHLFAGVRFLLLDFHIGGGLASARASAALAGFAALAATLAAGVWLW